jgi:MFS family permease
MANDPACSKHPNADNSEDAQIATTLSNVNEHLLTGKKLGFAFTSMLLALLRTSLVHSISGWITNKYTVIALDQNILSTALPRIASDFNAVSFIRLPSRRQTVNTWTQFSQQGWIAASFVLTQTAFILFLSQILRVYPAKYVLLGSVVVFEIGSLLSGAAPNVNTLIGGRSISGVGAAGVLTGILQVMAQATRLEDQPMLFSLFESVFAL